jgi:hypothetical protein
VARRKYHHRQRRSVDPFGKFRQATAKQFRELEPWLSKLAMTNLHFRNRVWHHPTFQELMNRGVEPWALLDSCAYFHALAVLSHGASDKPRWRRGRLSRHGRPPERFFSIFQVICDKMVSGRPDGRRFYAEFAALARLVFGKTLESESYHRALMRTYARIKSKQRTHTRIKSKQTCAVSAHHRCAKNKPPPNI